MPAEGQDPPAGRAEDLWLRAKLHGETATAPWRELLRFFAQGAVVAVAPGLDLVAVGLAMSRDRVDLFQHWLAIGQVALAADAQAKAWLAADAHLWTLVVKPWILVQEFGPASTGMPAGVRSEPSP
jgi:hypothetical protein